MPIHIYFDAASFRWLFVVEAPGILNAFATLSDGIVVVCRTEYSTGGAQGAIQVQIQQWLAREAIILQSWTLGMDQVWADIESIQCAS